MAENQQDLEKSSADEQKARSQSPPLGSSSSKLPPVEPHLRDQFAKVGPILKGSFQLDEKDKAKLPNKKWVHLALIVIPLGLFVSLVILLWAFFLNRSEVVEVADQNTPAVADEKPAPTLPPLPIIENGEKISKLKEYFAAVSPNWKDEYIKMVPEAAGKGYYDFLDSTDEDKRDAAVDFYTYLSNPGVPKTDEGFILFLNDVRADLEKQVGQPLYY